MYLHVLTCTLLTQVRLSTWRKAAVLQLGRDLSLTTFLSRGLGLHLYTASVQAYNLAWQGDILLLLDNCSQEITHHHHGFHGNFGSARRSFIVSLLLTYYSSLGKAICELIFRDSSLVTSPLTSYADQVRTSFFFTKIGGLPLIFEISRADTKYTCYEIFSGILARCRLAWGSRC